jgi:hypothetical protein
MKGDIVTNPDLINALNNLPEEPMGDSGYPNRPPAGGAEEMKSSAYGPDARLEWRQGKGITPEKEKNIVERTFPNASMGLRQSAAFVDNVTAGAIDALGKLVDFRIFKFSERPLFDSGSMDRLIERRIPGGAAIIDSRKERHGDLTAKVLSNHIRKLAEYIAPTEAELLEHNSFGAKLVRAAAAAPGAIAAYGTGTILAGGNPIAGMAAIDALEALGEDKPMNEVLMEGAKGALMGGALKMIEPWSRIVKGLSAAGIGAGATAISGGDTEDALVSALTMGGLAIAGPGAKKKGSTRKETKAKEAEATVKAEAKVNAEGEAVPAEPLPLSKNETKITEALESRKDIKSEDDTTLVKEQTPPNEPPKEEAQLSPETEYNPAIEQAKENEAVRTELAKKHAGKPIDELTESDRELLRQTQPTFQDEEGTTFQAVFIPGLKEFVEQDITPATKSFLDGVKDTGKRFVNLFYPTAGANRDSLDLIMKMKGERDKFMYDVSAAGEEIARMADRLTPAENVDIIDRIKRGLPQESEYLQKTADLIRKIDDGIGEELKAYKPSMPLLENHYRVLWRTVPGKTEEGLRNFIQSRRPLEGSKGFFKRHTLEDMSEGIAKGGVPYTYNFWRMAEMAWGDALKYITAQKMWGGLKDIGARVLVKPGETVPEGFVRLNDRIAKIYFPMNDGEAGFVKAGSEWYVEASAARLLNNYLSKDYIRGTAFGRGVMWVKNMTTAAELSLSPFHLMFETTEVMGSALGTQGIHHASWGIAHGNTKAILEGLKSMNPVNVISSPYTTARLGGSAIRYVKNPEAFIETLRGKDFINKFPEAQSYIDDMFTGGAKMAIHEDYKLNTLMTFKQNLVTNNYIGAAIRSIPALNQILMRPLFEVYIPRLKIGMFLKEYSMHLTEREAELKSGKMTKAELARNTWDFVEDRLGETNFDNIFWDRTFKTAMQVMFRSVTWKLGNIQGFGKAVFNQAKEFKSAFQEKRIPEITPATGWALGIISLSAAIGYTMQYMMTGKKPEELLDYFYPRFNEDGDRVSIPTYMRDAMHLTHGPAGYVRSSMSGFIGRAWDVITNKDFYGVQVYDPEETYIGNAVDAMVHMMPLPFSISSMKAMREKGETGDKQAMAFFGFTKAPYYITKSEAEIMASEILAEGMSNKPRTKEEAERSSLLKQYVTEYRRAAKAGSKERGDEVIAKFDTALKEGKLKEKDIDKFINRVQKEPFEAVFGKLSLEDALKVWKVATPQEKATAAQVLIQKILNMAHNNPEKYERLKSKIDKVIAELDKTDLSVMPSMDEGGDLS